MSVQETKKGLAMATEKDYELDWDEVQALPWAEGAERVAVALETRAQWFRMVGDSVAAEYSQAQAMAVRWATPEVFSAMAQIAQHGV